MSETLTLEAEARDRAGKGASRALRRAGRVPAVIYGDKQDPMGIHVEERVLNKMLQTGHFLNSVVDISAGGKTIRTLPRDVQFNPVTDRPIHVDFLRMTGDSMVEVLVPVVFVNEDASPGLKKGGVLSWVRHEVEVSCPADAIPDDLVCSLEGVDIGESIHISKFKLPANVKPTITDRDFTVATLSPPTVSKADDEAAAAAEGGE